MNVSRVLSVVLGFALLAGTGSLSPCWGQGDCWKCSLNGTSCQNGAVSGNSGCDEVNGHCQLVGNQCGLVEIDGIGVGDGSPSISSRHLSPPCGRYQRTPEACRSSRSTTGLRARSPLLVRSRLGRVQGRATSHSSVLIQSSGSLLVPEGLRFLAAMASR